MYLHCEAAHMTMKAASIFVKPSSMFKAYANPVSYWWADCIVDLFVDICFICTVQFVLCSMFPYSLKMSCISMVKLYSLNRYSMPQLDRYRQLISMSLLAHALLSCAMHRAGR